MIRKSPAFIRKQENDSKKKLLAQKHLEKKSRKRRKLKKMLVSKIHVGRFIHLEKERLETRNLRGF